MARNTLAERMRRLEMQKNRLQLAESKIKADERKARTRRLIEAGGLIEKAGLIELEPNALYGALLSLKDGAADQERVAKWAKLGGQAFDREAKERDAGKEPLVLAMPGSQPADVTAALRAAGFRWNKVMQHWEGLARYDDAEALADRHGGTLRRLRSDVTAAATGGTVTPAAAE
jgi:hypothetical protein